MLQWGRGCSAAECRLCVVQAQYTSTASMGPRLFSRGMAGVPLPSAAVFHASMGPRLFSRGMGGGVLTGGVAGKASMGPRLFSRGMDACFYAVGPEHKGFNGAAAVQPRNEYGNHAVFMDAFPLQWGRGCSAAECHAILGGVVVCYLASMGPRLFSRGMKGLIPDLPRDVPLQWGRGCSAAEWRWSAAPRFTPGYSLQWGRGCSAAECRQSAATEADQRPRFNGAAAVQPRNGGGEGLGDMPEAWASMGPRLFSRGMLAADSVASIPRDWLQWGRGCSAAEWCSGLRAAERTRSGFNGAAAVQPRNERVVHHVPRLPCALQWGRGCSAAECRFARYGALPERQLQWGRGCSAAECYG